MKMGYMPEYRSSAEVNKLVTGDYEVARAIAKKIGLQK